MKVRNKYIFTSLLPHPSSIILNSPPFLSSGLVRLPQFAPLRPQTPPPIKPSHPVPAHVFWRSKKLTLRLRKHCLKIYFILIGLRCHCEYAKSSIVINHVALLNMVIVSKHFFEVTTFNASLISENTGVYQCFAKSIVKKNLMLRL